MIEETNLWRFILVLLTSLAISVLIVATKSVHQHLSLDEVNGVQKYHSDPTPRIGGLALFGGYVAAWVILDGDAKLLLAWIGLAGLPVLLLGLAEDVSKNISIRTRMIATLAAGSIFTFVTGYSIKTVYWNWLDILLALPGFSIAFTAFSIGSASNAINIIDGFHGLASGTLIIMLSAIGIIAWNVGDTELFQITLAIIAITVGFFFVNFPFGKLFLGDGGAYFLGYLVAAISIMLAERNLEVSPWVLPLILSYPLTELVVSISRKTLRKGHHPGKPDNLHLHMLVYRLIRVKVGSNLNEYTTHALTSAFLWMLPIMSLILSVSFDYDAQIAKWHTVAMFCIYLIPYNIIQIYERNSRDRKNDNVRHKSENKKPYDDVHTN